jgi:hypothetical protein
MDGDRFDTWTKRWTTARSRRVLLRGLLGGGAIGVLLRGEQGLAQPPPSACRTFCAEAGLRGATLGRCYHDCANGGATGLWADCGGDVHNLCQTPTGLSCIDRWTDPLHCGACHNQCQGSTPECILGTCQPTVVSCSPGTCQDRTSTSCLGPGDACILENDTCCVPTETGRAFCSPTANAATDGQPHCCLSLQSYCLGASQCCDGAACVNPGTGETCPEGGSWTDPHNLPAGCPGWCCMEQGRPCDGDYACCYGLVCSDDGDCVAA